MSFNRKIGRVKTISLMLFFWAFFMSVSQAGFWAEYKEGYTKFHDAAKAGDIEQLKHYIGKGVDINKRSRSAKCTALGLAVNFKKYNSTKFLLNEGADSSVSFRFGKVYYAPLQWAAGEGDLSIVRLLMKYVDSPDEGMGMRYPPYDGSAFTWACIKGHPDISEYLFEQGADLNIKNSDYMGSSLVESIRSLHLHIALFLLENGANVLIEDSRGRTAMDYLDVMLKNGSQELWRVLGKQLGRIPSEGDKQRERSTCKELKRLLIEFNSKRN